ncbi:GNAT family N-acetyltransferase [Roseivirga pacifica]|uniref:GNAT family N-acetyltransferase n=1 Tax=Roseivirga pacifica TaxID=1267423 RepID=UPI00209622F6|nr:GNAT family N-acetyltransferase [Roseivirga pacifica]MCO6357123.1 GNAT family N-acetyltransferase [Roseivirga pacifica]MCO6368164.1 GNAT family N-acetyltransferase [Roseivirga pacifica]MCO6369355.1 GNAT family N-acetyltransferase [Roseivirga pacifica]MCO6373209.1 GNAT family N-acetyltransferase [Roseivirga pacifica]MCO6377534.1 GNAT family N-acetyltransferase [Roseivirga pacifica]
MKHFIRPAKPTEFNLIGELLVEVFGNIPGFPTPETQPRYFDMLRNIGELTKRKHTQLLVCETAGTISGAVVYITHMSEYGSGGIAPKETDTAAFRLLAVSPQHKGQGIGKSLSQWCIATAKAAGFKQMIIHTTESMQVAWGMYERLGFKRATDLDFMQENLPVLGFRLIFNK